MKPRLALMVACAALAASLAAAEPSAPSPIAAFQQLEQRLFTTGWRLALSNAPYCPEIRPASGLLLHDAAAYGDPAAVRETLGLMGDIGIQAVAPGSPADAAGAGANDTLLGLGEREIARDWPPTDPSWQRMVALNIALDSALAEGPVALGLSRSGEPVSATIAPVTVCASRFQLSGSSDDAEADGERVLLGTGFPGFTYPEDELAAAIAHELAHNILGHIPALKRSGRKQSLVRLSERDADRMMPWLLANAGYDPKAAVRFMAKWGPEHGGGLLRKRTHDGWDERVEFIEVEIARVEAALTATGKADWRQGFEPEFAPEAD